MKQLYFKRLILLCHFTFLCLVDLICVHNIPWYKVQDFVSVKMTESKSLVTYYVCFRHYTESYMKKYL